VTVRPPKPPKQPKGASSAGPVRKIAKAVRTAVAGVALVASAASGMPEKDPLGFLDQPNIEQAYSSPAVLLPYQQDWIADEAQLKVAEKSRRVGLTWAEAADDVTIAMREGGSNVFYISATQDMAREYIEACAMWVKAFNVVAAEIEEGIYEDGEDSDGSKRFIKIFEIVFPKSGKRITALSSRPTNLRGKQGVIVIDEAAFHNNLNELLKAAMAMLLWGDKVRIISTHDGANNPFNELIEEIRAGKRGSATVHRITFKDAVAQGLYRRVCIRKGIDWEAANEDKWVADAYGFYGEAANEELDVVPNQSGSAYLSLALISERMTGAKPPQGPALIRMSWEDSFAYQPEDVRRFAIGGWLHETVLPHLQGLHPDRKHTFGWDFARNHDLSCFVILEANGQLEHRVKMVIEMTNCPFSSQEQILNYSVDRLPRFRGGAIDSTGNGASHGEKAAQRYGTQMIEQVKLNDTFYLAHMPKLRAGLQDGTLTDIPRDEQLRDDLRAIKLVEGVPKIPRGATQTAGKKAQAADGGGKVQRHGDFAIALFLAEYAFHREAGEIGWMPAPDKSQAFEGNSDNDDDYSAGWGRDTGTI
jgi:phage FluMu gp28-like protein